MPDEARPIKVLHLSAADSMLFPILRDQLCFLRDRGYEIHTASISGPLAKRLRDDCGFPWTALPLNREVAPLRDWNAVRFVERLCRKERFDIVHTHTPKGNFVGQWGARRAGVPIVLQTLHGFYFHENMSALKRQWWIGIEKFSARHSDHILSQNPEDVDTAIREKIVASGGISLLGNGIDLEQFKPGLLSTDERETYRASLRIPGDAKVVGMCGRFVAEKGAPEFLEAGKRLLERHADLHLLLVGHKLGSERAGKTYSPEMAGMPDAKLTVLHDRDDMPKLYGCMDVHVLPSHREGFPRALMEGAASGLAQVATQIRGCRQTVADQQTGFLVPVMDVDALTERIDTLLTDAALRERMGRAARELAEREFDQQKVFSIVEQCYERLLSEKLPDRNEEDT